jgi:hypothetical protein
MDDNWWLQHIFGLSLADKTNPDAAQVAADVPPVDALGLITRIFTNCGTLLAPFTDRQVAEGLVFLGAAGESEWMCYLYDSANDRRIRFESIRSIAALYRDCFARRCSNKTAHLDSKSDRLNAVCFMWWDCFPGGGFATITASERHAVESELIAVMASALQIEHSACQESALHGLGHWGAGSDERVRAIIVGWLASRADLSPELVTYARAARRGNVL